MEQIAKLPKFGPNDNSHLEFGKKRSRHRRKLILRHEVSTRFQFKTQKTCEITLAKFVGASTLLKFYC